MNRMTLFSKKYILLGVFGLVLVVGLSMAWRYLTTGKIVVNAPSSESIIVVKNQEGATVLEKTGKLSAAVGRGEYTVSVSSKTFSATKQVHIAGRQTHTETFTAARQHDIEPVVGQDARSIAVSADTIRYLAASESYIIQIDGANTISTFPGTKKFVDIQWADPNYGVAMDSGGELFEISGSTIRKLTLPVTINDTSYATASVNADRSMYVSIKGVIYYGNQRNGLKKIYTANTEAPRIISTSNHAIILESETTGADHPEITNHLTSISKTGDRLGETSIVLNESMLGDNLVAWSRDGKRIAVFNGGSDNAVYNERLRKLQTIPGSDLSNPHWINSTTLVYSQQNLVWRYDTTTQTASVYASVDGDTEITTITSDPQEQYMYLTSSAPSGSGLLRVGLKDQTTSPNAYDLAIYLPYTSGEGCGFNYINFRNQTKILITAMRAEDFAVCSSIAAGVISSTTTPYDTIPKQYLVNADQTIFI